MSSFKWGNGVIHVTSTTVATRMKTSRLQRLAGIQDIADEFQLEVVAQCAFYLAHVDKVEGDVGFDIPNGDATADKIQAFVTAFSEQEQDILDLWDNAILEARNVTNDPDLLPPHEIEKNA